MGKNVSFHPWQSWLREDQSLVPSLEKAQQWSLDERGTNVWQIAVFVVRASQYGRAQTRKGL